jgi:hypothetical protein
MSLGTSLSAVGAGVLALDSIVAPMVNQGTTLHESLGAYTPTYTESGARHDPVQGLEVFGALGLGLLAGVLAQRDYNERLAKKSE